MADRHAVAVGTSAGGVQALLFLTIHPPRHSGSARGCGVWNLAAREPMRRRAH